MDKFIVGLLIGIPVGVFFHAAISLWFARTKSLAHDKLREEIAALKAKL